MVSDAIRAAACRHDSAVAGRAKARTAADLDAARLTRSAFVLRADLGSVQP